MYELQVQLTKKIYGRVMSAIIVRKRLFLYIALVFAAIAMAANSILVPSNSGNWTNYIYFDILVLILICLPILQSWFGYGWKNHPIAAQQVKYLLIDRGLNIEGESYNAFQAWDNFTGVKQVRDAVVLFFTQNQIYIFPNESFSSAQQQKDVVAFIKQHIPVEKQNLFRYAALKRFVIYLSIIIAGAVIAVLFSIYFGK